MSWSSASGMPDKEAEDSLPASAASAVDASTSTRPGSTISYTTSRGSMNCPATASAREITPVIGATNLSDRKSTRLNSSHQIISYAVFCLKKKMTYTITQPHATPADNTRSYAHV